MFGQGRSNLCSRQIPGNELLSGVCDPNGRGDLANETNFSFIA